MWRQFAVLSILPQLCQSAMWPVSLSVDWRCYLSFFHHHIFVSNFVNSNPLADAFVVFGVFY
jgi:hypothetical protein